MNIHNIIVSFKHFIVLYWPRLASVFYDEIWRAENNTGGARLGDITEITQHLETA